MEVISEPRVPAALPPAWGIPVPFEQKAGWTPEAVWTSGRRQKFLVAAGPREFLYEVVAALQLVGN